MVAFIKNRLALLIFPCVIITCTFSQKEKPQKGKVISKNVITSELTLEQQAAFDALNTLQTSTDEKNRLYSTFPNINHPCYPADTSFEVSQSELQIFMELFVSKHCQEMIPENRLRLAKSSAQAQEEYTVFFCMGNTSDTDYEKGLPMSGTWVLPNILGRRDVILVW